MEQPSQPDVPAKQVQRRPVCMVARKHFFLRCKKNHSRNTNDPNSTRNNGNDGSNRNCRATNNRNTKTNTGNKSNAHNRVDNLIVRCRFGPDEADWFFYKRTQSDVLGWACRQGIMQGSRAGRAHCEISQSKPESGASGCVLLKDPTGPLPCSPHPPNTCRGPAA